MIDENLRRFATPRQWEVYLAVQEHGSQSAAATVLDIKQHTISAMLTALRVKAAKYGYSPSHDMTHPAPDGFVVKGTSTLYDATSGEAKIQWVKTDADKVRQHEIFMEAIEALKDDLPQYEPVAPPSVTAENLMAAYVLGDHHFGMYATAEEAGDDYDLGAARDLLMGAMDHLVLATPHCDTALLCLMGDLLHHDGQNVTPTSRHVLDNSGRYHEMVRAAIQSVRHMVRRCLEHHAKVHIIVEIGNHDLSSSIFLMECLAAVYEADYRVTVDTSPSHFHYFRFGKVLIATHRGHGAKKPADMVAVVANDRPEDWGATRHRFCWTGHVHHKQQAKDVPGAEWESFRVLPPSDAWAANSGYRAKRDMQAIIMHREHGEVGRHVVNPSMLKGSSDEA
jgi:hypothetical protein